MKFQALFLSCCVALAGCATQETLHQVGAEPVVTSVASLNKSSFKLDSQALVTIDKNTQVLNNKLIDSPVVAFDLPANRGPLDISVTSNMTDEAFFSPEILMVDNNGNVIEKYDSSAFEYRRPRLAWGDRLVAEVRFTPPVNQDTVTMLIYTTKDELGKTTDRIHPARAMAEGKGNYLPEVKDIPTAHASTGKLLVEVKGVSASLDANNDANKHQHELDATVEKSTQDYYHNAIRKAVDEDNMPKALALLEEAKDLQIQGAQQVYIDALEQHRNK
ncbi:MalM family protein [Vibrio neonatus]|uniref:MalM family protein n=1 Tax=Vibrio neonatus TaxID=278860 RepID=UPI0021C33BEA|nr:MalM family protein [Vibrio neonatus]